MKRDMDLVRQILLEIEGGRTTFPTAHHEVGSEDFEEDTLKTDGNTINHHLLILEEANYIKVIGRSLSSAHVEGMTWEGHDFIDTLRDPEIYRQASSAAAKIGGVGVKAMVEIGKALAKQKLQEMGIPIP